MGAALLEQGPLLRSLRLRKGTREAALREPWTPALTEQLLEPITRVEKAGRVREARAAPKVGRNAPCPCGSGRKYKRCCGTKRPGGVV